LIQDDDRVKGAIISALSRVVATKDNIEKAIEESRRQFKDIYKRLDKVEQRIAMLIDRMDKNLEEARKSREAIIGQMNKGFEEARKSREAMFEKARKDRKSLRTLITTVSTRSGPQLENLILEILDDELIQENIQRASISKVELTDLSGEVFYKNYNTDIDVAVQDGKTLLIEVKSKADNRDINDLLKKAQLYKI
jgi:hypothetical protein